MLPCREEVIAFTKQMENLTNTELDTRRPGN